MNEESCFFQRENTHEDANGSDGRLSSFAGNNGCE